VGAVLAQGEGNSEVVIAYASRMLPKAEPVPRCGEASQCMQLHAEATIEYLLCCVVAC
jgi:hypothetical protein